MGLSDELPPLRVNDKFLKKLLIFYPVFAETSEKLRPNCFALAYPSSSDTFLYLFKGDIVKINFRKIRNEMKY